MSGQRKTPYSKGDLQAVINDARRKLSDIEYREEKEAAAALVGKCFRYRNSYSIPKKPSDYWWLYCKVIGTHGADVVVFQFQTDQYGILSIEHRKTRPTSCSISDSQSISQAEFDLAWRAVQKRVARWKP